MQDHILTHHWMLGEQPQATTYISPRAMHYAVGSLWLLGTEYHMTTAITRVDGSLVAKVCAAVQGFRWYTGSRRLDRASVALEKEDDL